MAQASGKMRQEVDTIRHQGAAGVLLQRLARAGFRVVGLEAGPFWDTERGWVSDEVGSHQLYWNELRTTGGKDLLAIGANNSGRGIGGRLGSLGHVHTEDGVEVD